MRTPTQVPVRPYGPVAIFTTPKMLNAGSTYGLDTSVGANYGLGTNYVSRSNARAAEAASAAAPSYWWLAGAAVVFWLVTR